MFVSWNVHIKWKWGTTELNQEPMFEDVVELHWFSLTKVKYERDFWKLHIFRRLTLCADYKITSCQDLSLPNSKLGWFGTLPPSTQRKSYVLYDV